MAEVALHNTCHTHTQPDKKFNQDEKLVAHKFRPQEAPAWLQLLGVLQVRCLPYTCVENSYLEVQLQAIKLTTIVAIPFQAAGVLVAEYTRHLPGDKDASVVEATTAGTGALQRRMFSGPKINPTATTEHAANNFHNTVAVFSSYFSPFFFLSSLNKITKKKKKRQK